MNASRGASAHSDRPHRTPYRINALRYDGLTMPSFSDSIFIFMLALMLFGPKKLPQLARQLGKLMAEFRRASSEFRMQMEDELRIEEQKDHQQKVAALASPPSASVATEDPSHPHMPTPALPAFAESSEGTATVSAAIESDGATPELSGQTTSAPVAIAESGELRMMPPSTGLPVSSGRRGNGVLILDSETMLVPEHTILPPDRSIHAGMSSEDPVSELAPADSTKGEPAHHA